MGYGCIELLSYWYQQYRFDLMGFDLLIPVAVAGCVGGFKINLIAVN